MFTLDFTNICRPDNIQELASADEGCVVKEIHEFFGDYIPIGTDHYTLNLIDGVQLCRQPSNWKAAENNMFHRATDVSVIDVFNSLFAVDSVISIQFLIPITTLSVVNSGCLSGSEAAPLHPLPGLF